MTLTKADIVERIYIQMGFSKAKSSHTVESLVESIKRNLESGDDVLVSGFGKFCVKHKDARKGRNPATGEAARLPARRVVTFKCSQRLRERINAK
jgi:integration host factor subunit alpha